MQKKAAGSSPKAFYDVMKHVILGMHGIPIPECRTLTENVTNG